VGVGVAGFSSSFQTLSAPVSSLTTFARLSGYETSVGMAKRKVDFEKREFKDEWTHLYCFIENGSSTKPVCVICHQSLAVNKVSNLSRHHQTNHKSFVEHYPLNSTLRTDKIASMKKSFIASKRVFVKTFSTAERATEASLRIAWKLGQRMKPFSDSEIVKECMLEAAEALFDEPEKCVFVKAIKELPMSDTTTMRRSEQLAQDTYGSLIRGVNAASCFALAIDESTDVTDVAQVCVYIRFFNGVEFIEDLLGLFPLDGQTRGEDLYEGLIKLTNKHQIDLLKMIGIASDGAPSMVGRGRGLVGILKQKYPNLFSIHCIIHQTSLCGKLSGNFNRVMIIIMKLVNFLRSSSSLMHRKLREFLKEQNAEYDDLIMHCDVRWLSKGRVLERFCALRCELLSFLSEQTATKADIFISFISNADDMFAVAFLADIMSKLNELNLKLQGRGRTIVDLCQDVSGFQLKLQLYRHDLETTQKHLYFPKLNTMIEQFPDDLFENEWALAFIDNLLEQFNSRFSIKIEKDLGLFVNNPFLVKTYENLSTQVQNIFPQLAEDVATLQIELIDLQCEEIMRAELSSRNSVDFWTNVVPEKKYPICKKLAINILTLFGSTYVCEAAFSIMTGIKTRNRNRLTNDHLHQCMRMALTTYTPDFKKIVAENRGQTSH
jgi:zinc finger BED domain-containing protein 5/7/8/9